MTHVLRRVLVRAGLACFIAGAMVSLSGCSGIQSALEPAGQGAQRIADLFWWMAAGAGVVWLLVVGLAIYAVQIKPQPHNKRRTAFLIIGGGALFPTVVLGFLLVYGLSLMPELLAPAPEGSLKIAVAGEQWWWRVRYQTPDGRAVELANEIHMPVGEHVEFQLSAPDVIHAFWIPSLGGKIDMVPGRHTRLSLHPTRTGLFRGACAEYCGSAHALMNFYAVVEEKAQFARWLQREAEPALAPADADAIRGQELFLANGCGACHTIRGTPANGPVGPDLTHIGSRVSIGAGILPNEPNDIVRWISHTERIKPGVHMPSFGMLRPEELRSLAAYLNGLK